MSRETILIAAFSGRSLAQSARRAGLCPLVADAFGDQDTLAAADASAVVPGAFEHGFRAKPLISALEELAARAATKPLGLLIGSGLEDKPRLVAALAQRWRLLGADAAMIAACKDPARFFPLLDRLDIPHPQTSITPPEHPAGWLSKRIGGSGGRHIRSYATPGPHAAPVRRPRRYFQRFMSGDRISVGVMATSGGAVFDLTRQWCAPCERQPFRYGGAVTVAARDVPQAARLLAICERLTEELGLVGMASLDFIVDDDDVALLEVNPRPGAALDVLDDEHGWAVGAHIAACLGATPPVRAASNTHRAAAILHADHGPLTLPNIAWPDWTADRGAPATRIPRAAPITTVFADAATADDAEKLARARLAELEDLLYGQSRH